jgi:hypothetical protein
VKECLDHDLLTPYPVYVEKPGEFIAQFKCTIAVLPRSTVVLAGDIPFAKERYETDKKVSDADMVTLINSELWKKEDKKKVAKKEEKEEKKE